MKKSCGSGPPRHIQKDDFNLKTKHKGHHKSCKFGKDQGENQLLLSKNHENTTSGYTNIDVETLWSSEKNDPQMMGSTSFHICHPSRTSELSPRWKLPTGSYTQCHWKNVTYWLFKATTITKQMTSLSLAVVSIAYLLESDPSSPCSRISL